MRVLAPFFSVSLCKRPLVPRANIGFFPSKHLLTLALAMMEVGPDGLPISDLPLKYFLSELANHVHARPAGMGAGLTATREECLETDAGRHWWSTRASLVQTISSKIPTALVPLFSTKAILYGEQSQREPVLALLLAPSPDDHRLRNKEDDDARLKRTVEVMYKNRTEVRAFGSISGSPGQGKTYIMRLLLRSQRDLAFLASLPGDVRTWWSDMPVFVISYNGRTQASYIDLELSSLHWRLPHIVRLLFIEMQTDDYSMSSWSAFHFEMLRLVTQRADNITVLLDLAGCVFKVRQLRRAQSSGKHVAGILLADELLRVSNKLVTLHKNRTGGAEIGGAGATKCRTGVAADGTSPGVGDGVIATEGAAAIGTCSPGRGDAAGVACGLYDDVAVSGGAAASAGTQGGGDAAGAAGVSDGDVVVSDDASGLATGSSTLTTPARDSWSASRDAARLLTVAEREAQALAMGVGQLAPAQRLRSSLCAMGQEYRVFVCISSLSCAFVEDQSETPSGSVEVKLCEQRLMEPQRVGEAAVLVMKQQHVIFQVSRRSDRKGIIPAAVVGDCLGTLAGGHPRAAMLLLRAVGGCDFGSPFFSFFLSALQPAQLSVARSSIDLLLSNPIAVAVGLLGFGPEPGDEIKEGLTWDAIYTSGALTRSTESRATSFNVSDSRPCTRSLMRRPSTGGASSFTTRLNLSFLLEVLKRRDKLRRTPSPHKRRRLGGLPGGNLLNALTKVRVAFEKGEVAVAWEDFVLWALVSVCEARHVCSTQLRPAILEEQLRTPLGHMSLVDLFPASPPFVGDATWLESARVDATSHRRGTESFTTFADLLEKDETTLLSKVWKPEDPTFPAVDGVIFFTCTKADKTCGPRAGQLVAVLLQIKHKEKVDIKKDVVESCMTGSANFCSSLKGKSWSNRVAFVLVSYQELTRDGHVDLAAMAGTSAALVVDGPNLAHVFGPCLFAFVQSSPVLFGTQAVEESGTGEDTGVDEEGTGVEGGADE